MLGRGDEGFLVIYKWGVVCVCVGCIGYFRVRVARVTYDKVFTHSRGMTITGCAGRPLNN